MKRTGLGKGISALFSDEALNEIEPKNEDNVKEIDINLDISDKNKIVELKVTEVEPNIKQARKEFNYKKLEELAESIKTFGVVQPIIVAKKDTHYEIIAGERRWRASKLANLKTIPAIIKDDEELENVHISIIENVQRENLNAIEYFAPDTLEWEDLEIDYKDFLYWVTTNQLDTFYQELIVPDLFTLDLSLEKNEVVLTYPFIWSMEYTPSGALRKIVSFKELLEMNADFYRQLRM